MLFILGFAFSPFPHCARQPFSPGYRPPDGGDAFFQCFLEMGGSMGRYFSTLCNRHRPLKTLRKAESHEPPGPLLELIGRCMQLSPAARPSMRQVRRHGCGPNWPEARPAPSREWG